MKFSIKRFKEDLERQGINLSLRYPFALDDITASEIDDIVNNHRNCTPLQLPCKDVSKAILRLVNFASVYYYPTSRSLEPYKEPEWRTLERIDCNRCEADLWPLDKHVRRVHDETAAYFRRKYGPLRRCCR